MGLTAAATDGGVVLAWRLPVGWPFNYYEIVRHRPELGEAEPLVHVRYTPAEGASYTDTAVEPGVLYVYRVKGVDSFGYTHEASEPVEVRTPESTPVVTSPATAAITPASTLLTAEFLNGPPSHDGQNPFTLELRFSQEFSVSYKTLRDHAFTVTAGTVTKARRLSPPGSVRWEITIVPDSNADVVVVLPATHNCDDQGALCTSEATMLSTDVTLTIPGPAVGTKQKTPSTVDEGTLHQLIF